MNYTSEHLRNPQVLQDYAPAPMLSCNWQSLRRQLMMQWPRITSDDLDKTGPNCQKIAMLIQSKYRIGYEMLENYLRNFERTMPLQ